MKTSLYYSLCILLCLLCTSGYAQYDLVVAQDGSGDYTTVQAAVNAAPSNSSSRTEIYIKSGTYYEVITVPSNKTNLTFIGQSRTGTVLTYDNYASKINPATGSAYGTSGSSSSFINGAGFYALNLTFRNTAGAAAGQAVAVRSTADKAIFKDCNFLGYQDTYYAHSGRAYHINCYFEGNTDFIFGGAIGFFESCQIYTYGGSAITAASTESYIAYGYVFNNCQITGAGTSITDLGRPWRPYASVTFLNTSMSGAVRAVGWNDWGDASNQATARYSEYNNSGSGYVPGSRPSWVTILSSSQAQSYTMLNVLKATNANPQVTDNWDPNTTINSSSGSTGQFNGTYFMLAAHSGKAIDTYDWGTVSGTNIAQWTYWGGDVQRYIITPVDGEWHRITPYISTGQALDIAAVSTASGANVQTWVYNGGYNQQFKFQSTGDGYWNIIARHSGKCLDVASASTADGANIQQWSCDGYSSHQKFQLVASTVTATSRIINTEQTDTEAHIRMYPNPGHHLLTIETDLDWAQKANVVIYDEVGRSRRTLRLQEGKASANIEAFSSGLYIVKISNGFQFTTLKFIKE